MDVPKINLDKPVPHLVFPMLAKSYPSGGLFFLSVDFYPTLQTKFLCLRHKLPCDLSHWASPSLPPSMTDPQASQSSYLQYAGPRLHPTLSWAPCHFCILHLYMRFSNQREATPSLSSQRYRRCPLNCYNLNI